MAESRLSGTASNEVNSLKKKQATIKTQPKPMIYITLLVVVHGSPALGLLFPILYIPVKILNAAELYEDMITYMIGPNVGYLMILLHLFVHGLCYKQVCELMMKVLKRVTCRQEKV